MANRTYQLLPDLSEEEYEALRADIAARGVMVPVEYDEQGNVLDGHHRVRVCGELGITDWPKVVRLGMSEDQKREHVLALNLDRRHLTREQRAELVGRLRSEGWSTRRIADRLHVDDKTVRNDLEGAEYSAPDTVTGKDGKEYPAERQERPRPATLFNPSPGQFSALVEMPEERREVIVEKLVSGEAKTLKEAQRQVRREEAAVASPLMGKYRVLYADPPWAYGNTMPESYGVQDDHYPTITMAELCALPVKDIAEDNAVLFLWVTSPILHDCFELIAAWGFAYKASFVWDKVKHVMGHYNSVRHELLLICVRGSCQPDVHKLFDSVVTEERTEHSRKPAIFREIIDTIYPDGARIELFARERHERWASYGNEN
ncbi:MAG: MT-A70 family methyltransferase [Dehalococcoidia bacterium]|nr:MT-A70 family methyltransferase [Dehalococcoidia bacterium]